MCKMFLNAHADWFCTFKINVEMDWNKCIKSVCLEVSILWIPASGACLFGNMTPNIDSCTPELKGRLHLWFYS